jgi:hypothetical protein
MVCGPVRLAAFQDWSAVATCSDDGSPGTGPPAGPAGTNACWLGATVGTGIPVSVGVAVGSALAVPGVPVPASLAVVVAVGSLAVVGVLVVVLSVSAMINSLSRLRQP